MSNTFFSNKDLSQEIPAKIKAVVDFYATRWDCSTIGDLFSIQQGKSVSKKNREGISQRPFLRTSNVGSPGEQ